MRIVRRLLKWLLIALLLIAVGLAIWIGPQAYSALHPSHEHDKVAPTVPAVFPHPAVLVFSKTNGFRHDEAIVAGNAMFRELGAKQGWSVFETENGAVFTPELLSRFQAVVWANVSGDALSNDQRGALRAWIEAGGGFVAIHGSGGDFVYDWKWYGDELLGAQFIGHTLWPHITQASVRIEAADHPVMAGLPAVWNREDEWYSFDRSVRGRPGFRVLATLDEASYKRGGPGSAKLAMGKDHPIVWSRCLAKGRVLYSALGHTGASYSEPNFRKLVTNAVTWAMRREPCDAARSD